MSTTSILVIIASHERGGGHRLPPREELCGSEGAARHSARQLLQVAVARLAHSHHRLTHRRRRHPAGAEPGGSGHRRPRGVSPTCARVPSRAGRKLWTRNSARGQKFFPRIMMRTIGRHAPRLGTSTRADQVRHRRNTRSSAVPRGSPRANRRLTKRDAMSDANGSPPRAMEEEDDDRRPQRSPREGSPERKVRRRSSRRERRRTDAPRGHLEPLDAVGGAGFGDAARDRAARASGFRDLFLGIGPIPRAECPV